MSELNNKTGIEKFIGLYFKNFARLTFANLLFFIPVLIIYFIFKALGAGGNIFIYLTSVIFLFPFYEALCFVSRKIMSGGEARVSGDYIKALKENSIKSLLIGAVLYAVALIEYFSITVYYSWACKNSIFWLPFSFSVLLAAASLFFFFNVSIITVSFEMKVKDILKNSMLCIFGEIKRNLLAFLGILLIFIITAVIMLLCPNVIITKIAAVLLTAFILPSAVSSVTAFALYDNLKKTMGRDSTEGPVVQEIGVPDIPDDILDGDDDDYIYYNGKMIKRSVLKRLKEERN